MKSRFMACLLLLPAAAFAQEQARVISATPVVQHVNVPTQVCGRTPVTVAQPKTGAGAVMGAVAGGVVGNAVGKGAGNAAATVAGVVGGAILGDRIEGQPTTVQNMPTCSMQMVTQSKTIYNVIYEYAGREYAVEMPSDPGPSIQIQVTPVGQAQPPMPPSYPVQQNSPVVVAPQPVYVAPYPYGYPYYVYPPFSVGVGYYRGYGHRH